VDDQLERVRRSAEQWRQPTGCPQCGQATVIAVREDHGAIVVSAACPSGCAAPPAAT
jgi:hypothetical protein